MQGPTKVLETVSEKGCATTRIPNTQHKDIKPKERAQQRVFVHIRGQHLGTLFAGGDKGVWAAGSECLHSSWGEEALTHLCLERSSPCPLYLA